MKIARVTTEPVWVYADQMVDQQIPPGIELALCIVTALLAIWLFNRYSWQPANRRDDNAV